MARFDIEAIRSAAAGRWPEVLAALSHVSPGIFDGHHHPCPKSCHPDAGGKDRFRLIDPQKGACLCSRCFTTKNGDGFASLQWLLGVEFKEALRLVAEHLGIKPKAKGIRDPAEDLEFLPWNPTVVGLWCLKKKPIKPESVQMIGGRVARYREQYIVIAFPVLGKDLDQQKPVGWVIMRSDGGTLPVIKHGKVVDELKIKTMPGTGRGVIGFFPKPKVGQ